MYNPQMDCVVQYEYDLATRDGKKQFSWQGAGVECTCVSGMSPTEN